MKTLTVKLDDADFARLEASARAAKAARATHARQLLLAALAGGPPPAEADLGPPPADDPVRRAVWALLVALSDRLDEDAAAEFVRDYFDAAGPEVGYRLASEGERS